MLTQTTRNRLFIGAGAVALAFHTTSGVHAGVVKRSPLSYDVHYDPNTPYVDELFDLDGGGFPDVDVEIGKGGIFLTSSYGQMINDRLPTPPEETAPPRFFNPGETVSFVGQIQSSYADIDFSDVLSKRYIAEYIDPVDAWPFDLVLLQYSLAWDPDNSVLHIDDIAFETTPGADLTIVGTAVPEPASLAALAIGAVSVVGRRRSQTRLM